MILVKNLKVVFEEKIVLNGINLKVEKGESIVIVGPSGCGKTVLLKTILGLIPPIDGEIIIDGEDILKISEEQRIKIRRKIGMVFQNSALFDSLNVWENVGFFLSTHSTISEEKIKEKVSNVLKSVGMEGSEYLMPEELSGGMKKRVSIARALIGNPAILFYDEPTTGLDPITSISITNLIKEIHKMFLTTDITVTHDVKLASKIADKIALLDNGKITEIGTFKELKQTSKNPLIKSYVEASEFQ